MSQMDILITCVSYILSRRIFQTKFLRDLTSRYDLLDKDYRNARGISRQGERFFTGAANRDAALSTAEKKIKKDHEEKEGKKHKGEARSNFFTRGKVPYS